MQDAETVLGVIRERGRRGLPLERLYRQLFNPQLFLRAYGRLYANQGAMTPGVTRETVDGMSVAKIGAIIGRLSSESYRWSPARRVYIPKKNGKWRPLGMPTWSDKLVAEVVRLLLEAYYDIGFSDRSHGFRPGRGCHTALREVATAWTGTHCRSLTVEVTRGSRSRVRCCPRETPHATAWRTPTLSAAVLNFRS